MSVDVDLLVRYMERFVGFGSYHADFWFIAMEQGGGNSLEELQRRLEAWRRLGAADVVDLKEYVEAMNEPRWHGRDAAIQPTLGKLIRIVLAARGIAASTDAIRSYQVARFGRSGDETLIGELLPLPSRSVSDWIYGGLPAVPYLRDRKTYVAQVGPIREALFRTRIERLRPTAAIFVGWSYLAEWSRIVGQRFAVNKELGVARTDRGGTACLVIRHPTSFGVTNSYFDRVGQMLADSV